MNLAKTNFCIKLCNLNIIKIFNRVIIVISATLSIESFAGGAASLRGVKDTLDNIKDAIEYTILKAEDLFEQNGGAPMRQPMNLLKSETGNPFLRIVRISPDYNVEIQLQGKRLIDGTHGELFEDATDFGSDATIPVTQALNGAQIQFFPVYFSGSAVITTWECITNADEGATPFIYADTASTAGNISFISVNGNPGDNRYISNCIYLNGDRF